MRRIRTAHGELSLDGGGLVMGILNVTPDSFSDGGRFLDVGRAVQRAMEIQAAGAELIDIGGESTRPGSSGVSAEEQIARVVPVIAGARTAGVSVPISIDTRSALVADAALDAGADIVNDVSSARHDPAMIGLLVRRQPVFIAMHMQGTPESMQQAPYYEDVVAEVSAFFRERARVLSESGFDVASRLMVDPGIGFGKTLAHNLALIRNAASEFGGVWPVVVGVSRKRCIGELLGEQNPSSPGAAASESRQFGSAAAALWLIQSGCDIVRVHDVRMVCVMRAIWREFRTR